MERWGLAPGVAASIARNFAAVSANCHGAPATLMGAGIVAEEIATLPICANPKARFRSLSNQLRGGAGNRGQQPFESALSRNELDAPGVSHKHQLIVALRDAQNLIDWRDPFGKEALFGQQSEQAFAERNGKQHCLLEQRSCGIGVRVRKQQEFARPLGCNNLGGLKKIDQVFPGENGFEARRICEIQCQSAGDQSNSVGERRRQDILIVWQGFKLSTPVLYLTPVNGE